MELLWRCCRLQRLSPSRVLQIAMINEIPKEAVVWALANRPTPWPPIQPPPWSSPWSQNGSPCRGREIVFVIPNARDYAAKRYTRSESHRLWDKFSWRLLIFPHGTGTEAPGTLGHHDSLSNAWSPGDDTKVSRPGGRRTATSQRCEEVPLLLRSPTGLCTYRVRLSNTVESLQQEISRRHGESVSLALWGRPLALDRSLSSYGIRAMSELQLCAGGLYGGGACWSEPQYIESDGEGSSSSTSRSSSSGSSSSGEDAASPTAEAEARSVGVSSVVNSTELSALAALHPQLRAATGLTQQLLQETGCGERDLQCSFVCFKEELGDDDVEELRVVMRLFAAHGRLRPLPLGVGPPGGAPTSVVFAPAEAAHAHAAQVAAAFDYLLSTISAASLRRPEDRRGATFWGLGAIGGSLIPPGIYVDPWANRFSPVPFRIHFTGARTFDVDAMSYEELLQLAEELGSVPHPRATPEMLGRLPLYRYNGAEKDTRCVICQEAYEIGEEVRKLPCSHTYHRACIDRWLTTGTAISLQCPWEVPGADIEEWTVKGIRYSITAVNWKNEAKNITKQHQFQFSNTEVDNGWHRGFANVENMTEEQGWLSERGELCFRGNLCCRRAEVKIGAAAYSSEVKVPTGQPQQRRLQLANAQAQEPGPAAAAAFDRFGDGDCMTSAMLPVRGRSRRDMEHGACRAVCDTDNCIGYSYAPCERICTLHGEPALFRGLPLPERWSTLNGGGLIASTDLRCGTSCYVRKAPCPGGTLRSAGAFMNYESLTYDAWL
eukprot:g12494.t2